LAFVSLTQQSSVPSSSDLQHSEGATQNSAEKTWSVREFVALVTHVIQTHLGGSYWITGEVTSLKQSNGHLYFDLSESDENALVNSSGRAASLSCALWAGKRKLLSEKLGDFQLADGIKIRVLVHCDFRQESSRLSAIVDDIDVEFTLGNLALNRQAIVRELRKRGLYSRNRETALPLLPQRIALITAGESRALSDFMDELKQSGCAFVVTLFDCHMQGENTSRDVCYALKNISQASPNTFDAVVITRGGGSRLDLRWFDDLEICKAIAYSPIPVITAIGHFEDVSIADEVAWCAEKTPTGAAGFFAERLSDAVNEVFLRVDSLSRRVAKRIHTERESLARQELRLVETAKRRIAMERRSLAGIEQTLGLVRKSSEKTLERGYALMRDKSGHVLTASAILGNESFHDFTLTLKDAKTGNTVEIDSEAISVRTIPPHTEVKPT
jgi:exodeoxyribonuclease VII large subunit